MKQRAIIVHGWSGSPQEGWFPWLAKELASVGFDVTVPEMPDADHPRIESWVQALTKTIGEPSEHLILVGHSIGCQTILRYLETISSPIGGAVLVAPWLTLTNLEDETAREIARPWLETPIDDAAVRRALPRSAAIFSSNDPFVPLENVAWFAARFGCKTTVLGDLGHLCGDDDIISLPVVLEAVKGCSLGITSPDGLLTPVHKPDLDGVVK